MAKAIQMTQEERRKLVQEFSDALSSMKMADGTISFKKTLGHVDRKATLYFTEMAYLKMLTLVREFDKEVAWHGLAKRGDDPEKDEYIIYDIMVYAQDVTSVTVGTEQQEYQMWLMTQPDEVFNNIRMQGHSHVNMGVTPSGVDNQLYDGILNQLEEDMFYIFLIWNKRDDKHIQIYDMAKNVQFETADVTVSVLDDGTGIVKFMEEAKKLVRDKVTVVPAKTYKVTPLQSEPKEKKGTEPKSKGSQSSAPKPMKPTTQPTKLRVRRDDWDVLYDYQYGSYLNYAGWEED